jgi:hypothetical protein
MTYVPTRADRIDAGAKAAFDYLGSLDVVWNEADKRKFTLRLAALVLLAADEARPKHPMTGDITDRLRGIYTVPVNDGAGLLDGKDTFTRSFTTPPVQQEAAALIDALRSEVIRLNLLVIPFHPSTEEV